MHFVTSHVDARVLMKLMDKTMQNEVHRIEQRTAVAGPGGGPIDNKITVEYVLPKGKTPEDYESGVTPSLAGQAAIIDIEPAKI